MTTPITHTEIDQLVLPYHQRIALARTKEYSSTRYLWETSLLNTYDSIGNRHYLLALLHEKLPEGSYVAGRDEWFQFYLSSGAERQALMNKAKNDLVSQRPLFGRTTQEIYNLTIAFGRVLKANGYSPIPVQTLFNMTLYRIVDVPYFLYTRDVLLTQKLNGTPQLQDLQFRLTKSHEILRYELNIIVLKTNSPLIRGGIRVVSDKTAFVLTNQIRACMNGFKAVYGISPEIIRSDLEGNIPEGIQSLIKMKY